MKQKLKSFLFLHFSVGLVFDLHQVDLVCTPFKSNTPIFWSHQAE